jgi:hypothetical protein
VSGSACAGSNDATARSKVSITRSNPRSTAARNSSFLLGKRLKT